MTDNSPVMVWEDKFSGHEIVPANQLLANPHNFRIHSRAQQAALEGSLDDLQWIGAVKVNRNTGHIFDGHLRVTLALRKGDTTGVPVDYYDLTPEQEAQALLSIDPIAALAGTDREQMQTLLEAVNSDNEQTQKYLSELAQREGLEFGEEPKDAEPQIDRAAELLEKWGVVSGDLWQIGEHRLLCGDSTKREDVERVMGVEKARLCFTSPPYADQRDYEIGVFDWLALMNGATNCLFLIMADPGDVVINLGMSYKDGRVNAYWNDWITFCETLGYSLYGWYVWDKGRGFPGEWNGRLAPAHEFIFHFSIGRVSANHWVPKAESSFERNKYAKKAIQRKADGEYKAPTNLEAMNQPFKIPDSVIRMPQETEGFGNHPAMFPVEFASFGIKTWGKSNEIVYEPFAGSGTTMVACQNLSRKCYGIEISPAYCAVILERMSTAFPDLEIRKIETESL
jgi:DNA modification methylase